MITKYALDDQNLLVVNNQAERNCWVNVVSPSEDEVDKLVEEYNLPKSFILDSLDLEESARIEYDDETDSTLILNDFPIVDPSNKRFESFITIPIGIVIAGKVVITICAQESSIVSKLRLKNTNPKFRSQFILSTLLHISTSYLDNLKFLQKQRISVENQMKKSLHNRQLYELMEVEKSLVYFLTSLKANGLVLDRLSRTRSITFYEEDMDLLEDVMIENKQGIETSDLYTRIINSMTETYSSLISNDMNNTMRALTVVTIVLTMPTLVFSFYGMNVELPFDDTPLAWIIIIGISIILCLWIMYVFRKNKMF